MKSCPVCGKTYSQGTYCDSCVVMLLDVKPESAKDSDAFGDSSKSGKKSSSYEDYTPAVNPAASYEDFPKPAKAPNPFEAYMPSADSISKQNKGSNKTKVIIAVLSVLLVAAVAVVAFFVIREFTGRNIGMPDAYEQNGQDSYVDDVPDDYEQNGIVSVETTVPETTTQSFVYEKNEEKAYETFNNFYVSYLYAINYMDSSFMTDCAPGIRYEMAERFEINKKSLFDLKRIDFDKSSLIVNEYYDGIEYIFYVKCVTMLYDRTTAAQKDLNYSCWKVTVSCENGVYQVVGMERDDKHEMSTDIYTVNDPEQNF